MSERIPVAVWQGTFRLFGSDITCAVLDDGRRVVDMDSLLRAMESDGDPGELEAFARWKSGKHSATDDKEPVR